MENIDTDKFSSAIGLSVCIFILSILVCAYIFKYVWNKALPNFFPNASFSDSKISYAQSLIFVTVIMTIVLAISFQK